MRPANHNNLYIVTHQFNHNALRVARELRGIQKNKLAKNLELTPSAITQFESGKSRPNAQTVGRISLALNFPPSFFAQPGDFGALSSDLAHFRSLRSSSQIERRKMVSTSALIGLIIAFVEPHVALPEEQVSPCTGYGVSTPEDIEQAAAKLRKDWGLGAGPISHIVHLLESKGILAFRLFSDCKRVDAFSLWHKGRPLVFLNTEKGSATRSRFDAVHELGHLIMHADYLPGDRLQEEQANKFASAFLLPRESFTQECPRRLIWPHFLELKQRWKVSLPALVRRAKDLCLISEHTYWRANMQIRQRWHYNEPGEPQIEKPSLLPQAIALLEKTGWTLANIAQEVHLSEADLHLLIYADEEDRERNRQIE
jgi:Zn-dependent peptidase ImmA (M78 family)/transcriptional regulator with XRE-family HTH domain